MCRQNFRAIKTNVAITEKEIAVGAVLLSHNITSNVYNQEFGRSDYRFMHKQTKCTTQLAAENAEQCAVFLFSYVRGFVLNHLHIQPSIYLYRVKLSPKRLIDMVELNPQSTATSMII